MKPGLNLPRVNKTHRVSGSFEVPEVTVKINLRPDLAGQIVALLKEAVEIGVGAEWFRPQFERTAATVAGTAGSLEYLPDLLELADLACGRGLLATEELAQVVRWAEIVGAPHTLSAMASPETRRQWDEARDQLQGWLDGHGTPDAKRIARQRSLARVTCADCNAMLAYLIPQRGFEFIVLARGDHKDFEVGHATGEYGGYTRTRCNRKKSGGRTWVLHADHLRGWLDMGNADVMLRHADKGLVVSD